MQLGAEAEGRRGTFLAEKRAEKKRSIKDDEERRASERPKLTPGQRMSLRRLSPTRSVWYKYASSQHTAAYPSG